MDLVVPGGDVSMRRAHLVVALSLGAAGLAWPACFRSGVPKRGLSPGHRALTAALEDRRPVEARLAGFSGHAPCRTQPSSGLVPDRVCSGPLAPGTVDRRALARAADEIRSEAEAGPLPAALHAAAVLALVQGRGDAVALLQRAVALDPREARAWSDLAAAYLVRAQRLDEPQDLMRALAAAERAAQLDRGLEEALFNRALAYEALFLPAARERWLEYLALDPEQPWRGEAESRIATLEGLVPRAFGERERSRLDRAARQADIRAVEAIVGIYRQESRELAEEELLGAWSKAPAAHASGNPLKVARAVGAALDRIGGDALLRDAVAAIDDAEREGDGERLEWILQGHRAFDQGMKLYRAGEYERGAAELSTARAALSAGESPFAARAAFWEACSVHRLGRSAEAAEAFARLERELAGTPYRALLGHASWMRGLLLVEAGDPVGGLRCYKRALSVFRSIGEVGSAIAANGLLTWAYHQVGRRKHAWEHAYVALRETRGRSQPRLRTRPYSTVADAALAEGYLEAALAFQDEAVRRAAALGSAEILADALLWRGLMRDQAGHRAEALDDIRTAREQAARISDASARRRMEADLSRTEGEISLASDPARAQALLTAALEVYQGTENHLLAVWVHRLRARAFRRAGDLDRAEADLRAALAAYERLEQGDELDLRLAVFARTEEAFDEMIAFQALDRGRPEEAFQFADRARTRVLPVGAERTLAAGLLDEEGRRKLLATGSRPLGLDEIRRRLPAGATLIQYAVLPDRLLMWRIGAGGVLFRDRRISAEDLRGRVARLHAAAGSAEAWDRESSALFELLVGPWIEGLPRGGTVVLVPDKSLHGVPFAALRDPARGRFLVQDHRIAVAPSATLAVDGAARPEPSPAGRIPALVVGDPAFDRGEWSHLTSLPKAAAEAVAVAAAVPGAAVLQGEAASRASFLDLARRADRVHFAGHALADAVDPLRSLLVLAPSGPGDPGSLYAWEIHGLDLEDTRLVVLSACGTADPALTADEGTTSLARAFLAAGVPRVIASLREVEDGAAGRLFRAFYGHPRAADDPVGALRDAQRALLEAAGEGGAFPWDWGAFEVIATQLDR